MAKRFWLTENEVDGPYIDFVDRALGYHNELNGHVEKLEISNARKNAAYAGAMVQRAGGDFSLLDETLKGYEPALPTLREYIDNDDANAYLEPRARLVSQFVPVDRVEEMASYVTKLLNLDMGEDKAPEA